MRSSEDLCSVHAAQNHTDSFSGLLQPCDKLISPVKEFINHQWLLAQHWHSSNLDILLVDLSNFTGSYLGCLYPWSEDVSTASCQCLNYSFPKSLGKLYYSVLCSFSEFSFKQQFKPGYAIIPCNRQRQFSNCMRTGINCVGIVVQNLQDFGCLIRFFWFDFCFGFWFWFLVLFWFCFFAVFLFDCFLLFPVIFTYLLIPL